MTPLPASIPRPRAALWPSGGRRLLACVGVLIGLVAAPFACAAEPVDLVGTWYVLVHYKDSATAHPNDYRWDDRIWVIERKGSRLEWTEYPIVVFQDDAGRFERDASGTRGRVLHPWEPSSLQLKEIHKGLQVNPRGKKRKTLRLDDGTYRSVSSTVALSANQVTYQEAWSIADAKGLPIFERIDSLGSARAETMDGVTRYSVTEVRTGDELRGKFERDESRRGRFRMLRAGAVGRVPKRKTPQERDPNASLAPSDLLDAPLTPAERRELEGFQARVRELDALGGGPAARREARVAPEAPAASDE